MGLKKFRDSINEYLPEWLTNRPGLDVGYRFVWAMAAPLDALFESIYQGGHASFPGDNYTALPLIARSRGILRGADDTDEDFAVRLRAWLDTHREAGRQETLAKQLHEVLPGRPRVRVVNRHGQWVTVNADGSIVGHSGVSFNWDTLSHPARSTYWSEVWIVIYADPWAYSGTTILNAGLLSGRMTGLGHLCRQEDVDIVKSQCVAWKAAHTFVRAVVWTSDASAFDPTNPGTLPNGKWGQWSIDSGANTAGFGSRVASSRDLTTTRYWEPFYVPPV